MTRVFKRDPVATAAAGFQDKDSYISFRLHPGTNHPCQYLAGDDIGMFRRRIFERDKYKCTLRLVCDGTRILPLTADLFTRGHLEHLKGGDGADRCWCYENCRLSCFHCHMKKDGRYPRFGEK